MPKKIQEVTTALKLIRKFALVGAFTPALDESIVPVVLVDDLSDSEEWSYAMMHDGRGAPGAGNYSTWSLDNEANSGKVAQLLTWSYVSSTAGFLWRAHVIPAQAVLALTLQGRFQDLRAAYAANLRAPITRVGYEALGAALGALAVFEDDTLVDVIGSWLPEELLVYPGEQILFQAAVNVQGRVNMTWRERSLRSDGS